MTIKTNNPRARSRHRLQPLRGIEERNALAEKNLRLVHSVANKFKASVWYALTLNPDYDDLVAAGYLGLLRACELFDESKGFTFATYAYRWIWQQMQSAMQTESVIRISTSVFDTRRFLHDVPGLKVFTGVTDSDGVEAIAREAAPDAAPALEPDENDLIRQLLRTLDKRSRRIFRLRYWHGLTLGEIGREVRITKERVRQLLEQGVRKMRIVHSKRMEALALTRARA